MRQLVGCLGLLGIGNAGDLGWNLEVGEAMSTLRTMQCQRIMHHHTRLPEAGLPACLLTKVVDRIKCFSSRLCNYPPVCAQRFLTIMGDCLARVEGRPWGLSVFPSRHHTQSLVRLRIRRLPACSKIPSSTYSRDLNFRSNMR